MLHSMYIPWLSLHMYTQTVEYVHSWYVLDLTPSHCTVSSHLNNSGVFACQMLATVRPLRLKTVPSEGWSYFKAHPKSHPLTQLLLRTVAPWSCIQLHGWVGYTTHGLNGRQSWVEFGAWVRCSLQCPGCHSSQTDPGKVRPWWVAPGLHKLNEQNTNRNQT